MIVDMGSSQIFLIITAAAYTRHGVYPPELRPSPAIGGLTHFARVPEPLGAHTHGQVTYESA